MSGSYYRYSVKIDVELRVVDVKIRIIAITKTIVAKTASFNLFWENLEYRNATGCDRVPNTPAGEIRGGNYGGFF